jgi:hypothetical protein
VPLAGSSGVDREREREREMLAYRVIGLRILMFSVEKEMGLTRLDGFLKELWIIRGLCCSSKKLFSILSLFFLKNNYDSNIISMSLLFFSRYP